jgi:carboxypeptidase Q
LRLMPSMPRLMSKGRKVLKIFALLGLILYSSSLKAQEPGKVLPAVFDEALTDRTAYNHLEYLSKNTKGRLAGSPQSLKAVEYTRQALIAAGADTVWLQRVMVPLWRRGVESCEITSAVAGKEKLSIASLGLSAGTDSKGVVSKVIEVHDFDELKAIGRKRIEGKIVFFNRPLDNKLINTFSAYSGAVNQRSAGASEASKYGAIAVIVRSMNPFLDNFPHTGVTHYALTRYRQWQSPQLVLTS